MSKLEGNGGKLSEHLWNMPISFSSFFRDVFAMEIGQLGSYANAVEQMLVEQMQKINHEFQEHTAGKSEEEREALLDWYSANLAKIFGVFRTFGESHEDVLRPHMDMPDASGFRRIGVISSVCDPAR